MNPDIDAMSEKELLTLRSQVDKAITTLGTRRRDEARKAAEAAAEKHGFSLAELLGGRPAKGKAKSVAKFQNPANSSQTWSGRGRQPGWVKDHLSAGKSLDDFLI